MDYYYKIFVSILNNLKTLDHLVLSCKTADLFAVVHVCVWKGGGGEGGGGRRRAFSK